MAQAVIFDLDGTLADTLVDIAAAVNAALARRGLPVHETALYRRMVGDGFLALATRALPEELRPGTLAEELRVEASALYARGCLEATRPYPGVPELLAELGRRGVPMAVLSNKPHELTLRVTAGLFPGIPFRLVRGESPAFPRKPDPASALDAAASLGAAPAATIYLGDSDVDMATALAAGMTALGAGWGFRGARELEAAGAKAVLATPGELLDWT